MKSFAARLAVLASTASLVISAPAAAAGQATTAYSPWAALSATASQASSQALCGSAAASAAASAAVQGATPGCVFPAVDAPIAPPVAEAAPLATPAAVVAGSSISVLPLLAGLVALGGLAGLLLSGGSNGQDQISVSP